MDETVDTKIISSFKEYLNHRILQDLNAYTNKTVSLYSYTAPRFSNKSVYGSPYASWIYDASITGASIPSGIGTGTGFVPRGSGGLAIDYKNGRLILNSGVSLSTTSLDVSVPEFNLYVTSKSTSKLIMETNFEFGPVQKEATTYLKPDSVVAPCIFLKFNNTRNKPYALGGTDESEWVVEVVAFADNLFKLYGIQKILRDIKNRIFPMLIQSPFNEYNDTKAGYWNYSQWQSALYSSDYHLHIISTNFKILDLDFVNERHPSMLVGLGTVNISKFRQPHSENDVVYVTPTVYEYSPS